MDFQKGDRDVGTVVARDCKTSDHDGACFGNFRGSFKSGSRT
jgi:hypothetical protein